MKTNVSMHALLLNTQPSEAYTDEEYIDFIEWENCLLVKSFALDLPKKFGDTHYLDQTDCEASINHIHVESLSMGLDLIYAWEKSLRKNHSERAFIILLSCDPDGENVTARFYQIRHDEPEWINSSDIEGYNNEALLIQTIIPNSKSD
ncbi:hypothetical protein [Paenibacillus sinopodophylli]|uniref:hypothetical protein n=1 Tax=Paenibacillus sinopodophylli TaxID=1837342 RepID=UPI00110C949E|nr:hypothetical protein [Paenibacillus sinopodophylli]